MNKINPDSRPQGFQAAQEASADYRLEQKAPKKTKEAKAKESASSSTSNSELVRCAESVGVVIAKWDDKLRSALEDLYEIGKELEALLDALRGTVHIIKIFRDSDDEEIVLEGEEALEFLTAMYYLGMESSVKIDSCSMTFVKSSGSGSSTSSHSTNGKTPEEIVKIINDKVKQGYTLDSIKIKIEIDTDDNNTGYKDIEASMLAILPSVYATTTATISDLKNAQTKQLFKVMTAFNFKQANIQALTNLLKNLSDNSRNTMNNIQ